MFFGYLGEVTNSDRYTDLAVRYLETALAHVRSVPLPPSLFSGYAGVAWACGRLARQLSLGPFLQDEDPLDEHLSEVVSHSPHGRTQYDLVSGVVGIGVYALERQTSANGHELLKRAAEWLIDDAQADTVGRTWFTTPEMIVGEETRAAAPDGWFNLGVAHGVPGVIAFLGRVAEVGCEPQLLDGVLDEACAWLLDVSPAEGDLFRFPRWILPTGDKRTSRSAWCYGDAGVAAALYEAWPAKTRAIGQELMQRLAAAALSRTAVEGRVRDQCLCHGGAGLGHIANRMFQSTGYDGFASQARNWLQGAATEALQPGREGILKSWSASGLQEKPGLLTGSCGVGLALLAAVSDHEPWWDRCLLLS